MDFAQKRSQFDARSRCDCLNLPNLPDDLELHSGILGEEQVMSKAT
jgi:hypothetical protein